MLNYYCDLFMETLPNSCICGRSLKFVLLFVYIVMKTFKKLLEPIILIKFIWELYMYFCKSISELYVN